MSSINFREQNSGDTAGANLTTKRTDEAPLLEGASRSNEPSKVSRDEVSLRRLAPAESSRDQNSAR